MRAKKLNLENFLLRFESQDEFIEDLQSFCIKEKINSGFFSGLGAGSRVSLAIFNPKTKKYLHQNLKGPLEIDALNGNITQKENKIHIHAHAVLSDAKMKAWGGHLVYLRVDPTLEIYLHKFRKIKRFFDKKTGFWLLDL